MRLHKSEAFFKGFTAVMAVVVLVTAYIVIRRISVPGKTDVPTDSSAAVTDAAGNIVPSVTLAELKGQCDFLIGCADSDGVDFLIKIAADLDNKKITAYSLPCDTVLSYSGGTAAVNEVYLKGGASALTSALGGYYGDSFDRYFICTPDNFIAAAKKLGYVDIDVREDISYIRGDTVINLKKGKHSLTGIDLCNYLIYGAEKSQVHILRSEAFADMLKFYLVSKNISQGEDLFSALINLGASNITAYDYVSHSDIIEAIAESADIEYIAGGSVSVGGAEG